MAVTGSNPVVGGTNLARAQINSPNYVAGSTGWAIKQDGSAEFNNVTIRGGLVVGGTDLKYSGTPAANNLLTSDAASAGADSFGNLYLAGFTNYYFISGGLDGPYYAQNFLNGNIEWFGSTSQSAGWTGIAFIQLDPAAPSIVFSGQVAAVQPGGSGAAQWQSVSSFGGTWTASGSGVNGFFYKLLPTGNVELAWDVSNNNANPGTLVTLPAAYRPATTVRLASGWGGTGPLAYNDQFSPMIQVASTGAVTGGGLFVGTLTMFGTAEYPLGSL